MNIYYIERESATLARIALRSFLREENTNRVLKGSTSQE